MRIFATSDSLDHWSRHFAHFPVILLDGKPKPPTADPSKPPSSGGGLN